MYSRTTWIPAAAFAVAFVALSPAPAFADNEVPSAPRVWEVANVTASAPDLTFQLAGGVHTWWNDYMLVGARLVGVSSRGTTDLDGNGVDDFTASEHGPHFEGQVEVGMPLYWRLQTHLARIGRTRLPTDDEIAHFGDVSQVSLVSGARLTLTGDRILALPLGVRLSKHRVVHTDFGSEYRERWIQVRAMYIVPDKAFGFDAEVLWMPVRVFSVGLYAEMFPALGEPEGERRCTVNITREVCRALTPITSFNPIPEQTNLQVGVRLRIAFPK